MENNELKNQIRNLEKKLNDLEAREVSKKVRMKKAIKTLMILSLSLFSLYGLALITQLHIFVPGEVISAQKINENFAYLESKISTGGGAGSGITVNRVTTYQNLNLSSADDNTLIVAEAPVDIYLPDISTVTPGFLVRIKQLNLGQFRLYPFGSDEIDGSNLDMYMQNSSGVAILTLVSDGVSWSKLLTIGSISYADFSTAATSCNDGEGGGGTNCYNDTAAQTAKHAFLADNYYVKWDGTRWYIPNDSHYLVDDSTSSLNQVYTRNSSFAISRTITTAGNGLYYYQDPSTRSYGMDIVGYSYANHNNSTNVDYGNLFFDPMNSWGHCNRIGPGWRFPRRSETSASDAVNGVPAHSSSNGTSPTWTATPDSATTNQFYAWDTTNTEYSKTEGSYNYIVCVNETAP